MLNRFMLVGTCALLMGCSTVDQTEYCVKTSYGKVVEENVGNGLVFTGAPGTELTCFNMTDQNFPEKDESDSSETTSFSLDVQTSEPLTVSVQVSAVYAFDPTTVMAVYMQKRSESAAEVEVFNSIQEGTRSAFSAWSVEELFSERRIALSDSVKSHIQRKLGTRAVIKNVFVKAIRLPSSIEEARTASAQQAQILQKAKQQLTIDSTNSAAILISARGEAEANELRARSYSSNAKLLDLEIAKTWSDGLSKICGNATTCIVGDGTMNLMPFRKP
jgi:regulator of protease activity HflC (stomatin/prohibitin superfamily)